MLSNELIFCIIKLTSSLFNIFEEFINKVYLSSACEFLNKLKIKELEKFKSVFKLLINSLPEEYVK
ncbi:hypothetical protein NW739_00745 [Mycoplasmopsis felis]|nr:hypothetical protein [Mycoplasmopsis felis]MCU9939075.1 hypothetical protein [Mycoplasmopsis felis]MCU9939361.1 hypothetical protein [Mycoplasmopsis felis]UWV83880.1 hypothetical protein NWE58_06420 [Mycoplasmopsis felis]